MIFPATIHELVQRVKERRYHRLYAREYYHRKCKTPEQILKNRQRVKEWRKKFPEKKKLMDALYREKQFQHLRESHAKKYQEKKEYYDSKYREWVRKNPNRRKEIASKYQKLHPEVGQAASRRRGARKKAQLHPYRNDVAITALYAECIRRNSEGEQQWCVDHIIPIAKGGFHHELNLQLLPDRINYSKGDDHLWEREGYKSWKDIPDFLWPEQLMVEYWMLIL